MVYIKSVNRKEEQFKHYCQNNILSKKFASEPNS